MGADPADAHRGLILEEEIGLEIEQLAHGLALDRGDEVAWLLHDAEIAFEYLAHLPEEMGIRIECRFRELHSLPNEN